jgi:hypothetical protein
MKKDFLFRKNFHIYALFIGLCLLYFNQIVFGKYYFFEDFLYQYYPFRNFFATSLRKGIFPLWDPYVFAGMSLIGDIQSALFYPFNIILVLFVKRGVLSFYALELQNILHILLAGVFTYMYGREIKLSKNASMISAVTFMFSGFLITRTIHLTFVNVIVWLPLILLCLQKALNEKSYFYSILGGLFMGLSMLAGSPQLSLHIFYFLAFYTLSFIVINRREVSIIKSVSLLSIILIISLGVAAIQYLPAFEYSKYTVRENISFKDSSVLSIHPVHLLTLLVPKLFGTVSGTAQEYVPFWGGGRAYGAFWEMTIYLGVFPLILLFFSFKDKTNKLIWFFASMSVFFLIAALGKYTPLYKFIYYCLPGFNKFRIPGRFSGLFSFSMAILAGFGANVFFDKREIKFPKVLFWLIGLVLIFWILIYAGTFRNINKFTANIYVYNNIKKQYNIFVLFLSLSLIIVFLKTKKVLSINYLAAFAVMLIFIDLFNFGHNFNKSKVPPQQFYPFNRLVRYFQEESKKETFRINAREGNQMILKRNSGNIYRLELIEGYTPLRIKRFGEFSQLPSDRRLDLLNVKYKLDLDKEEEVMRLVSNEGYVPRAFMVYKYTLVKEEDNILNMLSKEDFDYLNEVILEKKLQISLSGEEKRPDYKIKNQLFGVNGISLKVQTSASGFLVLSEIYNPAWQAYIDGQKTKIYCADYTLRAIPVNRGIHQVEMIYNPRSFRAGRIITVCTLILAVCLLFLL